MKLMSFVRPSDHLASWGLVVGDGVADLGAKGGTLRQALADGSALSSSGTVKADFPLSEVTFLPVVPDPDKILCVGVNYLTHLKETGREPPKKPMIFARWANSQAGHKQPMLRPKVSESFDYEGELAVIIGKRCRYVTRDEAAGVIAGYSCYNDGSIRDWQRHTIQFTPGKNFPQTGGFGPWLVTPDEMGDVTQASLVTRLNGAEVQRATIDDLVFDVPALIEYCSAFTELVPGDVIITGTTGGVGAFREPPLWMKPGDTAEVEISGIGTLVNPIAAEG